MKYISKNHFLSFLLTVGFLLLLATVQAFGANNETQTQENNPLLNKLLIAGCVAGAAVVLVLLVTQVRGKWQRMPEPDGSPPDRKAMSAKTMAFRCRECGKEFKEELSEEYTIECPLCGHAARWPPPIELKLLEDRMFAFALDPEKPRGDLTFPTKVISRLSKSLAERILIAGNYLDSGEMLCICERCREVHITQKRNRGLLGVCVRCQSELLIW